LIKENKSFKRGDVVLINLGVGNNSVQGGLNRPCVIISNNLNNMHSPNYQILPITSKMSKKALPTHILVKKEMCDIKFDSVILCEQIGIISKSQVISEEPLFTLNNEILRSVEIGVMIQLGLNMVSTPKVNTNRMAFV